jgi:hypothetical protein
MNLEKDLMSIKMEVVDSNNGNKWVMDSYHVNILDLEEEILRMKVVDLNHKKMEVVDFTIETFRLWI